MSIEKEKHVLNRKEAAQYLGVTQNTFAKLMKSGRIKFAKLERKVLVSKNELDKFLIGEA